MHRWVWGLLILGLSACGFHLRGLQDMPAEFDKVCIVLENANQDLRSLFKQQLQTYRIKVVDNPKKANFWVILERDQIEQHITSVSSSTTPRQYQMTYRLDFKVVYAKGAELLGANQVVVTRQITVNSDRILGSNDEIATLIREMHRDAVIQVLDRIGHTHP